MVNVTMFQRKPNGMTFSIERLFQDVCGALSDDITIKTVQNEHFSKGWWPRIADCLRAPSEEGDVNHITGDVHFVAYFLSKRKTILTIHDCLGLNRLQGLACWVYFLLWFWLPVRRVSVVTVVSNATKAELIRHIGLDTVRIEVIPNCVSPEFLAAEGGGGEEFNKDNPRVLHIGTTENKNLERVAEALSCTGTKLIVIGKLTRGQRETLQKFSIDFENHVGISRAEMVRQYQIADVLMFVSLYEGFGLPILEANAVGIPVITSDCTSMPEVAGDSALLVCPTSTEEIRKAFRTICDNSAVRTRLVENGKQNVKKYTAESVASQYAVLYRELAKT
jgi:glycosyltransferase involved in cell wall biosynthesis